MSTPATTATTRRERLLHGRRSRRARLVVFSVVAIALVTVVYAASRTIHAASEGRAGKNSLLAAERELTSQRLDAAHVELESAARHFRQMRTDVNGLGPLRWPLEHTPLLRVQLRGSRAFADAGEVLATSGLRLAEAASRVVHPADPHLRLRAGIEQLRKVDTAINAGIASLRQAARQIGALDGYRLLGPLESARKELVAQLPRVSHKAVSAEQGVRALIEFAGGNGPKRYLVFSQNPDEVRPTGGFIGTYGVLATDGGELRLDRFEGIENWYLDRPQAQIPPDQAGSPFQFPSPAVPQTIANVNSVPDWPTAARLAQTLWQRGGEAPVDGVLSVTPDFMSRVLAVLGPVTVPQYNEVITASNLITRADYWTHLEGAQQQSQQGGRKHFLAELAHVVVDRLLDAPSSEWLDLGKATAAGFDAQEAMAWSTDSVIQDALSSRRWDGALQAGGGDFIADSEFEYAAKNGRGLKRIFDHTVELHADRSARIHTLISIQNTEPPNPVGDQNIDSLSYLTIYGPTAAQLDAVSDPPNSLEDPLAGHPGAAWGRAAEPLSSTTINAWWHASALLTNGPHGSLEYRLTFRHLPGHTGDVLKLHVVLPPGWRWENVVPPNQVVADRDITGIWRLIRR